MNPAAREFLSECAGHHEMCPSNNEVDLPHRVLDVGHLGNQAVNLVEFLEGTKSGKYVALSYCWGRSVPFTTTPETLDDRRTRISVHSMPRTLRHAVEVTRQLGVRYLWVDAICIIQGDSEDAKKDWLRESSLMDKIYRNAFCTIAAMGAHDSEGGLLNPVMWTHLPFKPRDAIAEPVDTLKAQDLAPANESDEYCSFFFPEPLKDFKDEPLNGRGWAYQEWILSTRLLVFGSRRTYLVCAERPFFDKRTFDHYRHRLDSAAVEPHSEHKCWTRLVQHFASRSISIGTDKLIAFSAIVKRFHDLTHGANGKYLAGLWEKTLILDLAWHKEDNLRAFYHNRQVKPRSADGYRAPSWSWASTDGTIFYPYINRSYFTYVARVVKCTTQPSTDDQFAGLDSAELVIEAPFKPCPAEEVSKTGDVVYDDDTHQVKQGDTAYCILLCTHDSDIDFGLLLGKHRSSEDQYVRIGLIFIRAEKKWWWKNCKEKQVTIL